MNRDCSTSRCFTSTEALGSRISRAGKLIAKWAGLGLLPHGGAILGMALVAVSQFPHYRQMLLTVVMSSALLFELAGPIFTSMAISRPAGLEKISSDPI